MYFALTSSSHIVINSAAPSNKSTQVNQTEREIKSTFIVTNPDARSKDSAQFLEREGDPSGRNPRSVSLTDPFGLVWDVLSKIMEYGPKFIEALLKGIDVVDKVTPKNSKKTLSSFVKRLITKAWFDPERPAG